MRKVIIWIVLSIMFAIGGGFLILGIPVNNDKVAEMAEMNAQSRTFQTHTVKYVSYNVLNGKYYIKLQNEQTFEESKMIIWFDEEYERTNMYHCEWERGEEKK